MNLNRRSTQYLAVAILILVISRIVPNYFGSNATASLRTIDTEVTVQRGNITEQMSHMGQVVTPSDIYINSSTGSLITAINVIPGQHVKPGQILATLDSVNQQQTLVNDQATLNLQVTTLNQAISSLSDITQSMTLVEQSDSTTVSNAAVALANFKQIAEMNIPIYHSPVVAAANALDTARKKFSAYTKIYTNVLDGTPPYCVQTGGTTQTTTSGSGTTTGSTTITTNGAFTNSQGSGSSFTYNSTTQTAACDAYFADYATYRGLDLDSSTASLNYQSALKTEAINILKDQQALTTLVSALTSAQQNQQINLRKYSQNITDARSHVLTLEATYGVNTNLTNPTPSDFTVIQGTLDIDRRNIANQTITSPVEGDVGTIGGVLHQPAPIRGPNNFFTITNVSAPQLEVIFPLNVGAEAVKVGQKVSVNFQTLNNESLIGAVVLNINSPGVVNSPPGRRIRIQFSGATTGLFPGLAGNVSMTVNNAKNVLLVPNHAILTRGSKHFVELVVNTNNKIEAVEREISIGVVGILTTEIKSGLLEGQKVKITNG